MINGNKVFKTAGAQKARSWWTYLRSYELANVDVRCVCLRNEASRRRMQYDILILFVGCAKRLRWLEPGGFFAALSCRHRYPVVKVFHTPKGGMPGPELASAGLGSRAQGR